MPFMVNNQFIGLSMLQTLLKLSCAHVPSLAGEVNGAFPTPHVLEIHDVNSGILEFSTLHLALLNMFLCTYTSQTGRVNSSDA